MSFQNSGVDERRQVRQDDQVKKRVTTAAKPESMALFLFG
jgi:hypothetical protein